MVIAQIHLNVHKASTCFSLSTSSVAKEQSQTKIRNHHQLVSKVKGALFQVDAKLLRHQQIARTNSSKLMRVPIGLKRNNRCSI